MNTTRNRSKVLAQLLRACAKDLRKYTVAAIPDNNLSMAYQDCVDLRVTALDSLDAIADELDAAPDPAEPGATRG